MERTLGKSTPVSTCSILNLSYPGYFPLFKCLITKTISFDMNLVDTNGDKCFVVMNTENFRLN